MKEKLKILIINTIETWEKQDIYAISLFVYDKDDDPRKPTVTLGYNTESYYQEQLKINPDKLETKWNYAFWPQNVELLFGVGETEIDILNWIKELGLPYDIEEINVDNEKLTIITKEFINILIEIVKELHTSGFIKNKFGKEIPILIHELEYYHEIIVQNVKANGRELIQDFVKFCVS